MPKRIFIPKSVVWMLVAMALSSAALVLFVGMPIPLAVLLWAFTALNFLYVCFAFNMSIRADLLDAEELRKAVMDKAEQHISSAVTSAFFKGWNFCATKAAEATGVKAFESWIVNEEPNQGE